MISNSARRRLTLSRLTVAALAVAVCSSVSAQAKITLRGDVALAQEAAPPPLSTPSEGERRQRNYPMQPPLIPHSVRNYQIDLYVNKCVSCHARRRSEESMAPMISVTHYMNRDGNFLAEVSPRRYFCLQCHVTQADKQQLLVNDFVDIDHLLGVESP